MSRTSEETLERAFRLYRVEKRTGAACAEIMGTIPSNVSRWADRFQAKYPKRAEQMVNPQAAAPSPLFSSSFLSTLQQEGEPADETIPGFEDSRSANRESRTSAPPEAPDVDDGTDADPDDLIGFVRGIMRDAQKKAKTADTNETAARFMDQANKAAALIQRMQKVENAKQGLVIMSLADIDQAMKDVEAKAAGVDERCDAVRCADCGRAFRQRRAMDPKASK